MPAGSLFGRVDSWDKALFLFLNETLQNGFFDLLMPFITNKRNFLLPLALLFLYLFWRGGRSVRAFLLLSLVLLVLADSSGTALKKLFHRARPCQALDHVRVLVGCSTSFAFPSDHATNIFALSSFFAHASRRFGVPLFVFAFLVGFSRIYVGVHYPLDVVGGALLGIALGLLAASLGRRIVTACDPATRVAPLRISAPLRPKIPVPDQDAAEGPGEEEAR